MRIGFIIAGVALAAVIILAIQYGELWLGEGSPDAQVQDVSADLSVPAEAVGVAAQPPSARAAAPAVVLPDLDASDGFVIENLTGFGLPAIWLDREDLVRRLAVVIDNAPRGEYPRRQLGFLAPVGGFTVVKRGDEIYLDPASYVRYDGHLDAIESIDPAQLAQIMDLLQPLIAQGLLELGNQRPVSDQINAAIDSITALRGLGDEVQLVQPQVLYQFADPELEALSPLQKQALRLGPDNLTRLQGYLQAFQEAYTATMDAAGA